MFTRRICFFIASLTFPPALWRIFLENKISLFGVFAFSISPEMLSIPIIRDKANQGCPPDSSILLSRKPPNLRPFAAESIQCTCSTAMALSFLILVSISISPLPYTSPSNILFKKRTVPKPRHSLFFPCIARGGYP